MANFSSTIPTGGSTLKGDENTLSPDIGAQLKAGALGAGNGVLFGIPEFVYRRLGGEKDFQSHLAKLGSAYNAGNVAGSIGGAFIPGLGLAGLAGKAGRLAKAAGLGGRALEAGEAATGAARAAGEAGKLLEAGAGASKLAKVAGLTAKAAQSSKPSRLIDLVGQGALYGGAEGALRGVTGSDIGDEFGGGVRGLQAGTTFGALGGGLAGGLAKAAPKASKLLKKFTEKSVLGTTDAKARAWLQMVREMSPPGSGPGYQLLHSDTLREDVVKFIKDNKLWKEGSVEEAYEKVAAEFQKYDRVYDAVAGNKPAADTLRGMLNPDDTAFLQKKYSAQPDILQKAHDSVLKDVGNVTGAPGIREQLRNIADHARAGKVNSSLPYADAQFNAARYDIAKTLRSNLDDAVLKIADGSGVPIDPNFRRDWGFLQPLEKGALRADWSPITNGMGSPTQAKLLTSAILPGGGGLLGYATTDPNADPATKIANIAAGSLIGKLGDKALGRLGVKAGAGLNTLAGKLQGIAPKLAENALPAAAVGGGLGAISRAGPETVAAEEPDAPETTASLPVDSPQFLERMEQGIATHYMMQSGGRFGPADMSNPTYQNFREGFLRYITEQGPDMIQRRAASALFPNPEDRKAYVDYLDKSNAIRPLVTPNTVGWKNNLTRGLLNPAAQTTRVQLAEALTKALGKEAANAALNEADRDPKKASKIIDRALARANVRPDQLMKLIGVEG